MSTTPAVKSEKLQRDYKRINRLLKHDPASIEHLVTASQLTGTLATRSRAAGQAQKAEGYELETRNLRKRLQALGAEGEVTWLDGVWSSQRQDWEAAERAFLQAEASVGHRAEYWFDRGKMEFNRGRLSLAKRAFLKAREREEAAGRITGRTFRWLATTCRWLGQAQEEADILHEAMEYPWTHTPARNGTSVGLSSVQILKIDDSGNDGTLETATHTMAMERLPRLLIDAGKYTEAIDLIEEWYSNTHRFQAEFSAMKVEALFGKKDTRTALAYAEHMATRFKGGHLRYYADPRMGKLTVDWEASGARPPSGSVPVSGGDLIIAAALIHSNQPFSGNNRLLVAFKDAVPVVSGFSVILGDQQIPVKASVSFMRAYLAARRAVKTGRIDLATELLWEAATVAVEERNPLPLAACIHELSRVAGDHPKLEQLCQDASHRHATSAEIMLEVGRYLQGRGQHEQALAALDLAARSPRQVRYAEPLIAEVIGASGNHDEALARFKSILDRDWSREPLSFISEAIFAPAVRWAEENGQLLWVLSWADLWLAKYGPSNHGEAAPLFEAAGRAALSLREYERAHLYHIHAAAAHAAQFQSSDSADLNLRMVARTNAMTAFSALLAGRIGDVPVWLETARSQAAGLDVTELVSALALARSGDLPAAREALLEVERSSLWAQVARLLAHDCRQAGQEHWAEDLERKAAVQAGETLSLEEALDQLSAQERRLLAARQEVEANHRYREQTRDVLETLVVRSGLLPEDHASYAVFKAALNAGETFDPELILGSVLGHLADNMHGQAIRGDACSLLLGPDWDALEPELREQLELAQDYVAYAKQMNLKDYGPALMYLARPLEVLLRTEVANPLIRRAAAMGTDVPWDYEFTLGCAPQRLFGLLPKQAVSPEYRRIVDDILQAVDPSVRRYIRLDWRADAQALVDARNAWAHRRDALGSSSLQQLLPRVVGAPGSDTVLGAALAVRQNLRMLSA